MTSFRVRKLACLAVSALAWQAAPAQDEREPVVDDLTLPPSVDSPRARSLDRPGAVPLADPPARGGDSMEEVVVVGERRWRLPDLGSELRRERAAEQAARIRMEYFRLYDPADPTNRVDPFPINTETQRVGFIEVFRFKFGRR